MKENPPRDRRKRPVNPSPGRVVCICTAKGKIIYMEDRFTYNRGMERKNEHL